MGYYELLNGYIEKSQLSHREISRRCKDLGKSVSQAYISQLVRGDVPPASDEVNEIIAKVTDGDAQKLIWEAYIEKAPEEMKEVFALMDNDVMDSAIKVEKSYPGFIQGAYRDTFKPELRESEEFQNFKKAIENLFGYTFEEFFREEEEKEKQKENPTEWEIDEEALDENEIITLKLDDAYLDQARKIIHKTPRGELDQLSIINAIVYAISALEIRLNRLIVKAIVNRGLEEEWGVDYSERLSLKEKLESALKMHLGYDITTEEFYPDLNVIIDFKSKVTHLSTSTLITRGRAAEMIDTVEMAIKALNQKAKEKGIE